MEKRILLLGLVVVFVVSLSGCSTTRKSKDLEIQGLRNQVSVLESQPAKDEETSSSEQFLSKSSEESAESVTKLLDEKQIQTALKNAGYYEGAIDGKLGKKTRRAVRDFQKANNLSVDGKVGKITWGVLRYYLDKKVK